jgi:hypothetical protein
MTSERNEALTDLIERVGGLTDWPLLGYAPGSYFCKCHECKEQFDGDKRAIQCLPCAVRAANAGLAKLKELEIEVQAAKDFGGGFYAEIVAEKTRQFYRDDVVKRNSAALLRALSASKGDTV